MYSVPEESCMSEAYAILPRLKRKIDGVEARVCGTNTIKNKNENRGELWAGLCNTLSS